MMKRRNFLKGLVAASVAGLVARPYRVRAAESARPVGEIQKDWKSFLTPGADVALSLDPIKKSASEWKEILDDMQFYVLRKEGTERPFTSPLNNEKRKGLFACAGCKLPLFTSEMKYDSGTGWPSFFTHIPGHLGTKQDFALLFPRTEYHCIRCDGHQGHVFKDGPRPTGERWCNNGVALKFIPA